MSPLGLLSLEFHQFGNRVTQPKGEDRQPIPDTCFLVPFEVDRGPDPALLPLPQVCDRHRRRLKLGAGFSSVCIPMRCSTGIAAARAAGQGAWVGAVTFSSPPGMVLLGLTLPDEVGCSRLLGFLSAVAWLRHLPFD